MEKNIQKIKIKNQLELWAFCAVIGTVAGALVWALLKIMASGTEMIWEWIPERIHIPYYTVLVCTVGGAIIGIFRKLYGDYPEDMETVMGKVKKESKDGSSQVYDFQQLQVKARRGNKKIVELMTASPVIYTMRGIGTVDDGARVIGQYGIPARVVYLKDDKDGAVIMYGYNFPKNSKIGKSLDFYISSDGDVCRIVLSGEE